MQHSYLLLIILFSSTASCAQDSTKRGSRFWGDTWHFMAATTVSENENRFFIQPEIGIGRSKWRESNSDARHGAVDVYTSLGLGYSCFFNGRMNNLAHLYFDRANRASFPVEFVFTYRLDYMYNIDGSTHYLRPALGFTIWRFDILFAKNIRLGHEEYMGRNGISLRFRVFSESDFMDP
jgi:hypothetical protein